MSWSSDGSRLASGSFDKTVTVWTLESDRLVSHTQHTPGDIGKAWTLALYKVCNNLGVGLGRTGLSSIKSCIVYGKC